MKILVSPAHYILDINSQSEFYAAASVIYGLARRLPENQFIVVCGKCKDKASLPPNIILHEVFGKTDRLFIDFLTRIKFYLLISLASIKILSREKVDIIWHMLPNGLMSFNPVIFFQIDRLLQPGIRRLLGRLQYTNLPDLKHIDENSGKILHRNNTRIEKIIFKAVRGFLRLFSKYYFKLFSTYIFNNQAAVAYYEAQLSLAIDKTKCKIIPIGVNQESFSYTAKIFSPPIYLLFSGNLTENKRVYAIIEVSRILLEKGFQFETHIVGDGDERKYLEELSRRYELAKNVFFHGELPKRELPEFYRKAHILFLLSKSESFGQVLLEAWSTGTLFIGSDIPAFRDIVHHNIDGLLFDLDSPDFRLESLCESIRAMTQDSFDSITLAAKKQLKNYEWPTIIEEYSKLLE